MKCGRVCENCIHARRASNVEYVGCVKFWDEGLTPTQVMERMDIYSIQTGWAYLTRRPNDTEGDGSASSGVIANGVNCFPRDYECKFFEQEGYNFVEQKDY